MLKLRKIIVVSLTMLLFSSSYLPNLQANEPTTIEVTNEQTTEVEGVPKAVDQQETKTTEEVLTTTEQNTEIDANAPPMKMTEERAKQSDLKQIGTTEKGTKIWASAEKDVVDSFVSNPQQFQGRSVGNSSGMLTWMGTYSTPMIWLDGIGWVYCIQPYEAFPSGNWYDDGTWVWDDGLTALEIWGFPSNFNGQHGLSDEEAYLRTFVAINAYLGNYNRGSVESYGDWYVNMLLQKADAKDIPNETYTIHNPANLDSHYNAEKQWLETDGYEVTGASGTFWLENLPSGFQMVDSNNNIVGSLPIGSWFKIVTTNLGYTGTIHFDVKTDISPRGSIKFSAAGVQTLLGLKRRDPLPAFGTSANFKAAHGEIDIIKLIDPSETIQGVFWKNQQLDKIKLNVSSVDGTFSHDITLDMLGKAHIGELMPGDYKLKEIEVPVGLKLNTTVFNVTVTAGETLNFTLTNKENVGVLKVVKKVTKTSNKDATVTHDFTKVKVKVESKSSTFVFARDYYLKADGTLSVEGLPVGTYTVTELEVPPTMQLTATPQTIEVTAGTIATAVIATLTNTESTADVRIKKTLTNPTTNAFNKNYRPDYTKIQVRVKSLSPYVIYNKVHNLDATGELLLEDMPFGTYEVTEVAVPDDMHIDTTVHTIIANEQGKTYEVGFNNVLVKSNVRVGKKDSNGAKTPNVKYIVTSDILRWEDGTPKIYTHDSETNTYSKDTKPKGTIKDPKNGLYEQPDQTTKIGDTYTTDEDGQFLSDVILYGFKNLYIVEIEVPRQGHLYLDPQPKLVKLVPEGESYVQFNNIIKEQGQIQVNKKDEDGKNVAWYFDIYARYPGDTKDSYIETISTSSLDGIGRSTILQKNDQNGNQIQYKVCEQKHAVYKDVPCIDVTEEMWNSGKSIWTVIIKNSYKRVGAELWKTLETNMAGETAKGTEIVWKNKNGELLGTFKYEGNGKATILPTIRIDKLGDGKSSYIEETRYSEGAVKEVVKFRVVDIDFASIKDGQILKLNTESTAVVNKATRTIIDKVDPDQKRVPGAGLTIVDPETDKVIHKWIVKEDGPEEITGLQKDKTYKVCETLVPVGYKEPKTLCATFKTDKDGNTTTFNLINEYTQLIIHKIGMPEDVNDTLTGTQLPGAHLGIRLVSRPDDVEIGVSGEDTLTNNVETTENNVIEAPTYSYDPTTGTSDIALAFLDAKVGDTVYDFITTDQAEIIKGIPVGFEVEVYEITPPAGYELAEPKKVIISGTVDAEVTLIDAKTEKLVETGQNVFAFGMVGAFAVLSGFALLYIAREKIMRA